MISPPAKATETLKKSPAAKALPSRWIPPDDPKPREIIFIRQCQKNSIKIIS